MATSVELSLAERVVEAIDRCQRELNSLPNARDMPTLGAAEDVEERRMHLSKLLMAFRHGKDALDRNVGALASITSDRDDLAAIRDELCTELLAEAQRQREIPSRTRRDDDRMEGLKVSIKMIDGRFDYHNHSTPAIVPLFEKLKARGYIAPASAPWNVMAALFGSLPTCEARVATLTKQRDEASAMLESALRSSQ